MHGSTPRRLAFVIICVCVAGLWGCVHNPTGIALHVDDTVGPVEPAAIRFSQPCVFGRESLIADRVRENQFLEERLAKTASEVFDSQIVRDIRTISTVMANAKLSMDPTAAVTASRASELGGLRQEIEVAKLEAELLRVRRALSEIQEGTGAGPAAPSPSPASGSASPTAAPGQTAGDLQKALDDALAKLEKLQASPSGTPKDTTTPEATLRDQLAYRAEIRSAIAANTLDDTHDVGGNTVYRLAFRVQVLPGRLEQRRRWGFARLVVRPHAPEPKARRENVNTLYYTWLAYLNSKLAAASLDYNVRNSALRDINNLGQISGFFELVSVHDDSGRCYFKAAPPSAERASPELLGVEKGFREQKTDCSDRGILVAAAEGRRQPAPAPGPPHEDQSVKKYYEWFRVALAAGSVPVAFRRYVDEAERRAQPRVYSVMPLIRDQRMGSASSVLEAIQLSANVAGGLPSVGGGLEAGLGAANTAAGRIDAVERIPAVISMSGMTSHEKPLPWVGWVLGPQIRIDPSDKERSIELWHSVTQHEVSVDMAVPAWWPSLELDAQSVWIGAWTDERGADALRQLDAGDGAQPGLARIPTEHFSIPLAPTDASLAAFTKSVAQDFQITGVPRPEIFKVTPTSVRECDAAITFIVHGDGLWRRPEAYLEGVKSQEVSLLPDMTGLAIAFDSRKLKAIAPREGAELTIVTREGSATAVSHSRGVIDIESCPVAQRQRPPSDDREPMKKK